LEKLAGFTTARSSRWSTITGERRGCPFSFWLPVQRCALLTGAIHSWMASTVQRGAVESGAACLLDRVAEDRGQGGNLRSRIGPVYLRAGGEIPPNERARVAQERYRCEYHESRFHLCLSVRCDRNRMHRLAGSVQCQVHRSVHFGRLRVRAGWSQMAGDRCQADSLGLGQQVLGTQVAVNLSD
jgi:hypothetical protein